MKRIEFMQKLAAVMVLGTPLLTLASSCSSSADDPAPKPLINDPKDCLANGTTTSIGGNHGHSLTVSKTDVETAADKTYNIQGTSGHIHEVTITAANFSTLKSNQNITVTSSSDSGHTHSISVGCA